MTPHLDSEIMQQTIRLRRSWLVTPSSLFLQGSLKGAIAELFRTFQGVIVPERPAVHCSMRSRSQQCHPKKDHSPAEWAGCRVTDSHPPTNEPCRQTFAAHGRPRLSYREHHWIAPMRLTAAQPGPWLRPVNLQPLSGQNNTDQAKPPDIRPTQEDHKKDKNEFRSQNPPPNKEERDKGRETK